MTILDGLTTAATCYKNTIEGSVTFFRNAAECTATMVNVVANGLMDPLRSSKEIAQTCLGYHDFEKARHSFTTPTVTGFAGGWPRTFRRPVSERISEGVGHMLVGGSKAFTTIGITKTYIEGLYRNLFTKQLGTSSQTFVNGVHAASSELFKVAGRCTLSVVKTSAPIFRSMITNPKTTVNIGMRGLATGGCLYVTSYGIVQASETDNIAGKVYYSALSAMGLVGAFYTSGLNSLIGI